VRRAVTTEGTAATIGEGAGARRPAMIRAATASGLPAGRNGGRPVTVEDSGEAPAEERSVPVPLIGVHDAPTRPVVIAEVAIQGVEVHDAPTKPVSLLRARWEALADAIGEGDEPPEEAAEGDGAGEGNAAGDDSKAAAAADLDGIDELDADDLEDLDDDDDEDLEEEVTHQDPLHMAPVVILPRRLSTRPGIERASSESEITGLRDPDAVDEPTIEAVTAERPATEPPPPDDGDRSYHSSQWNMPLPDPDWSLRAPDGDVPPMPLREPTLILSDPGSASPALPPPPPSPAPPLTPLLDDELGADLLHDTQEMGEVSSIHSIADLVDPAARGLPAPSGGAFARELRKKMSLMAQRLFRTGDAPSSGPVEVGPSHDHKTEIDLAALDQPPALAAAGVTEALDLEPGVTFTGDAGPPPPGWEPLGRLTAEHGDVVRGHSDAAGLIARLSAQGFTGRLVLRQGAIDVTDRIEKTVHFDAGRPVFASSSIEADRMGQLLVREGKITSEQFRACTDLVRETGRRMGEILVERGYLKRRELLPAVRRHVEDLIYSLFAWDIGEYKVIPGDGAADERIRLSRHPAAMVLEGVRRKLDLATLERLVGPAATVIEISDREKLGGVLSVSELWPAERAALVAMDGQNDLARVAHESRAELANVYGLAWGLIVLGLATARRPPGDADVDADAPALVGETDLAIDRERVRARHDLVTEADYFALLGVRRDATRFEIKRAYEAARRDFAAETFPPELRRELAVELDEIAQVLDEAYRVLRDDRLRGDYLANLMD